LEVSLAVGFAVVAFPLTPALSLGEREIRRPSWAKLKRFGLAVNSAVSYCKWYKRANYTGSAFEGKGGIIGRSI
jgi:hypothetical protein